MATLILADIHGNLPALEAVLATPEAKHCREIISIGDQVNFGPLSRAVVERLNGLGAIMLLGNHEERLLHPADEAFSGYNWALMRWTAAQMAGIDLAFPTDWRLGPILFTHGTPGKPYHLVHPPELPQVLDTLPPDVKVLVSGHNHHRWDVAHGHRRAFNPGSLGMEEEGRGGVAPFAVLDGDSLTHHAVPYDIQATLRAFIDTGASQIAPELTRAVARVMLTGEYQGVLKLMRHVSALGDVADAAVWRAADATYPWQEPVSSPEYWYNLEKQ